MLNKQALLILKVANSLLGHVLTSWKEVLGCELTGEASCLDLLLPRQRKVLLTHEDVHYIFLGISKVISSLPNPR